MTVGLHTVNLANAWLNILRNTAFTPPTALYVKLHTGDPGSAGTANASAVTTRSAVTHAAAASGALAVTGTLPSFNMTTTEALTHVSYWDASSGGNVLWTAALAVTKNVNNGDTFTLATSALSLSPLMA